ncbi:MAG: SDR family oxidoreductase [Oscillospiraceae bacterium]|jgi:NAD(P)-dependent dehydrogenase (short-subunit alcohol dehydrogenase family)|nr:SDR family oxidoreductase [Oscillospiraceae bacterium]
MISYIDYGFAGRAAIVTGAGTGIGQACAIEFAKGGASVALFGRRAEKLAETRAECLKHTDKVLALSVDVSDEAAVKSGVAEVLRAFGRIDILVNNAGIESDLQEGQTFRDLFEIQDPEEYLKFFKIHALGHYLMSVAVLPAMKAAHFGRVVNITSVCGVDGQYSSPAYVSSKGAANTQTKAFASKYAPDNIIFNSISPGMVNTPMKKDSPPEEFAYVASVTPLGRVAEPIDIARVAMFFAQENLFVVGQNLIVDGAAHI